MHIGGGAFRWIQFYRLQNLSLDDHIEEATETAARAGVQAWEPFAPTSEAQTRRLQNALQASGLRCESAYVNARLHDGNSQDGVENAVSQARFAKELGADLLCVNPEPIAWHTPDDKSDEQLRTQAQALHRLGERLGDLNMGLAYHIHAPELRSGGREFHAMLALVPPDLLGFCFDTHWVYRGCGNSSVAVETVLRLYSSRIRSFHLRQSHGGVWSSHLEAGDLDYGPVAEWVRKGFWGPMVIEHGDEPGSPQIKTLAEMEQAHRQSVNWVRETFPAYA